MEAINKLVSDLDNVAPNDTMACNRYRELAETQDAPVLGYLKRLAITQHLEVILGNAVVELHELGDSLQRDHVRLWSSRRSSAVLRKSRILS